LTNVLVLYRGLNVLVEWDAHQRVWALGLVQGAERQAARARIATLREILGRRALEQRGAVIRSLTLAEQRNVVARQRALKYPILVGRADGAVDAAVR
jgi:hypothetical protein